MSTQIMNGGIWGGILRIAKDSGANLSEKDEAYLKMLESLPKNQWVDLDENGNPISKDQADLNFTEKLSHFHLIKP